ncbi:hypothetical protein Godav_011387 [Gossypium davidsonii]|uniref:Uncharacterized protein n=2 Tax=Gossypium TaxID=3633 RepID=A0A7J8RAJ3_GOSDV|nr:hypothetical protein [Gossypium davidsonii]MBA0645652.1 hypothetical protein [Gossypium klotzschianum]
MIGRPRLSAVKEVKEHLTKNIDRCYNDPNYYQTQARIDIIATTLDLLQQEIYQLWTDGRRILAFYTGDIQENRDEESLRLLKKIADIEIEDYPSHLLEQIKMQPTKIQHGLIIKTMMTQAVMEATINAIQRHPDADKKFLQRGRKHQIHDETRLVKRGTNRDPTSYKTNVTWK